MEATKAKETSLMNHAKILSFYYIFLGVIGFAMIMLPMIFYNTSKIDSIGTIGDAVGGILNPIIAIAAALLTFLAFYIQYQANVQVQRQFQVQQFESQYYEMLRLYKENVSEMRINGYERIIQRTVTKNAKNEIIELSDSTLRGTRFTEGRKVFVTMATELTACYELLEYYNFMWNSKIPKDALLKLAYQFFFFGCNSEIIWSANRKARNKIEDFRAELNIIRDRHRVSFGEDNKYSGLKSNTIKLYIKYLPFSGHENRLGHYYRHLYSTVKFVVKKEAEKQFDYNQSRQYLKLLRSQMSNDEQLMLYYNYIMEFGKDWEDDGYLTRYRMLHNLPIDKVKHVMNPRIHFKTFIASIPDEDGKKRDSLFEWGDYA